MHASTRLILIINIIYKKHTDFQDCRVGIHYGGDKNRLISFLKCLNELAVRAE